MSVSIVVLGCGHLGTYHVEKFAALPGVEVVGAVDPDREARERLARRCGVPTAASVDGFLENAQAAVVATPTVSHFALASRLLEAGLDVLVEKPLASSPQEALALVELAATKAAILQVGHTERFNPAIARAMALIDRPGYIVAERLGPFSGRSTDIDVILDLMIHDLDLVGAMVSAPLVEARSVGVPFITAETDMAAARLEFADGTVAQLSASRGSLEPSRKIRVFTRQRYLSIDCQAREVKSVRREIGAGGEVALQGEPIDVPDWDPLEKQDADFLRCVLERSGPVADGRAGLRAVELAHAVQEAMSVPLSGA